MVLCGLPWFTGSEQFQCIGEIVDHGFILERLKNLREMFVDVEIELVLSECLRVLREEIAQVVVSFCESRENENVQCDAGNRVVVRVEAEEVIAHVVLQCAADSQLDLHVQ